MGCSSQGAVPIRQPHLVRHRLPVTDKVACKDAYNAKEAYSAVAEPLRSRLAGQRDASGFDGGATQRLLGMTTIASREARVSKDSDPRIVNFWPVRPLEFGECNLGHIGRDRTG